MILKQVKQNGIEIMTIVLVLLVALSFSMFYGGTMHFMAVPQNGGPLFNTLYNYLFDGKITIVGQVVSLALMLAEVLMIILMNSNFELTRAKPSMFMLMFVPLALSFVPSNTLLPEQLANIFITLGLIKVFASHNMNNASYTFFDGGLFFGVALLFCVPALVMLLVGIIALLIFRPFKGKEFLVFVLGFFAPALFYVALYFLIEGTLQPLMEFIETKLSEIHAPVITYNEIICLSVVGLLTMVASGLILREYPKYNLFCSQAYRLMFFMFVCVLGLSATPYFGFQTMRLTLLPLTLLFVTVFHDLRQNRVADILFSVFVLALIALQILWYRL